jgi:hypothetical protein
VPHAQEIPACYFTRNFSTMKTYLGNGQWRVENQPPGPPWGHAQPPRKAMAFFNVDGQGVAIFSPVSAKTWNFGPHTSVLTDDSSAAPCMHVAPLDRVSLGPKSEYRFRYWLIVGTQAQIAQRLDELWRKYFYWPDFKTEQLFDLRADPLEENDRIADPAQAARLAEMRARFAQLKAAAQ